jgi:pimeloyl-ACP methyl ester carboxylesterase
MNPVIDCTTSSLSTVEWGEGLVRATVQPLGLAMLLISVLLSLIAVFFAGYISSFSARRRAASAVDSATRQGKAFSDGLDRTGHSRLFATVLVPLVAISTIAAILFWTIGPGDLERFGRDKLSGIAFPLAYILAVLAVAGVGLKNVGFVGTFGGGFLKILALVLDVIYDITTYLRVANPAIVAPRVRMIARYQAVLAHLRTQGYAHVVIMAHSQGSVLSLATLLGDPDRTPRVTPSPPDAIPTTITLLTYGCPATQTYARRFPTQFTSWPAGGPSIARWLNVYRAGDYVGRNIVAPDDYDPRDTNPPDDTGPANRQERCLGPGHHTGYFTDERWRRVARHVVATPCPASLADVDLGDLTVAKLDGPPGGPPGPADEGPAQE